jgi:hypothetical protein
MTAVLWGVGSYDDDTGARVAWEISHEEIQRDMGTAARTLAALGITSGGRVLFCSMLSEAGQFWPLVVGAMLSGAQLSCADANEGDAVRVAMFTRLVEYDAVLGITGAILDGLDALGRPHAEVFGGIRVLGARPDAYARLEAAGLTPHHFALCGPAVAVGSEPGAPAHADVEEWHLDVDGADGVVTVTNLRDRATTFARTRTAVRATVTGRGLVPHPSGRPM